MVDRATPYGSRRPSQNIRLNGLATARSAFGVPAGASRGAGVRSWHKTDIAFAINETLAINLDGAALDSCGHERSIEGLPQAEGSQAIANLASCAHRPSPENIKQRRS